MKENKFKTFLKKNKYLLILLVCAILITTADLIIKSITDGINKTIINGVLTFFSSYNTGGAWSLLENNTIFLTIISIVFIIVLVLFYIFTKNKNSLLSVALGFVIGGAIGNLIDRIFLGYVRDFIKLDFIKFPIFNIADSFIVIGVILLCVFLLFCNKNKSDKIDNQPKETLETKD